MATVPYELAKPVSLFRLKNQKCYFKNKVILKEDIWQENVLLLRKGIDLSENIIDKLLNFGIKEVCIFCNNSEEEIAEFKICNELKNIFLNEKKVLIFEKSLTQNTYLSKKLTNTGFESRNIFYSVNFSQTINMIKNTDIPFIFLNYKEFILNYENFIQAENIIQNKHIFIIKEETAPAELSKQASALAIQFNAEIITLPINTTNFINIINSRIDDEFKFYIKEKHYSQALSA